MTPVQDSERYTALDLLRGFSLFGVLLVNVLYFFRISLFQHILGLPSETGFANHIIAFLVTQFLEFKAFDLFSLTFGIGVAIQMERAMLRKNVPEVFLLRRFLILMGFGLLHLFLLSNVDILTLYSVCGLLLIPLLRLAPEILALAGMVALAVPPVFPRGPALPPRAILEAHVLQAVRIYSSGTFGAIFSFRWRETMDLLAPLLIGSAQKTWGLMLIGIALWRWGVVRDQQRYKRALFAVCLIAGLIGLRYPLDAHVLLALAYAAGLLAWGASSGPRKWTVPVAAAGRMALSNYLIQSLVFALLFYGYGFGLFGRISVAPAAAMGVTFYAVQLWFSTWWLQRYRFGPFEWLWRSMTYGQRQAMRRNHPAISATS